MYFKHSTNDLYTTKGLPDSQFKQETNACKLCANVACFTYTDWKRAGLRVTESEG